MNSAVTIREPRGEALPLIFDSPHSGADYPADFGTVLPLSVLREGEDRFVDELFARAPDHGALLLVASFPRAYVDPNREPDDIDPDLLAAPWPTPLRPSAATAEGVGLIWRLVPPDRALYDRRLAPAEVEARITRYWRPYREALASALDRARVRHGAVWHVNCHSMWSVGLDSGPDPGHRRKDICLSDRDGRSCDPGFIACARDALLERGYSVSINDPFKGGAIVARHGRPEDGYHSLQIEIVRGLYMDERTLEPHAGFERLRNDLGHLAERLAAHVRASLQGAGG
ncbi:MAG: N-formylglutamate amidohydrolase [Alphaproteobacteria bacterium]